MGMHTTTLKLVERIRSRLRLLTVLTCSTGLALAGCSSSDSEDGASKSGSSGSQGKAISVALSANYSGNNWYKAMIANFEAQAKDGQEKGLITDYEVQDAATDVARQATQIKSMILKGYDAILIVPGSPTGLNGAIKEACNADIVVVVFEGQVTEPCVTTSASDLVKYGEVEAEYVADKLDGTGNVLIVRGLAGSNVDADVYKGQTETLAKYPDMTIVGEVYGEWTQSTAQRVVAGLLPSLPEVDAVLGQGADGAGTWMAFQQAGRAEIPIITMSTDGQGVQAWESILQKEPDYETIGAATLPGGSTVALWQAWMRANGEEVPKFTPLPFLLINNDTLPAWLEALKNPTDVGTSSFDLDEVRKLVADALAGDAQPYVEALPDDLS